MKGLVFTFNKKAKNNIIRRTDFDLKYILRRYGSIVFFTIILIVGLASGSIVFNNISKDTFSRLDFFFLTNISQRLESGAVGVFCATFASNFLFMFLSFLMGYSLWGSVFLPLIVAFKGFGIGISASYLFINFGIKGIVFYLSVLLPGIFIVSMSLIYQSAASFVINKKLFKCLFSKVGYSFLASSKVYLQQSVRYLLMALFSAVLDMGLWFLLAGLFNFK